jgi:hypothetical protein
MKELGERLTKLEGANCKPYRRKESMGIRKKQ